jgi:hypothetical protein
MTGSSACRRDDTGRQPRRRRIRSYLPEWMLSVVMAGCSVGVEMVGFKFATYRLLQGFRRRWPHNPIVLLLIVPRALGRGDDAVAVAAMEELWLTSGQTPDLHRLLFRRSARPLDPQRRITLFESISSSSVLPLHYCNYAVIALAYQAIDQLSTPLMKRTQEQLVAIAADLTNDTSSLRCSDSNRQNRFKLLISTYTALSRLALALGEFDTFVAVGERVAVLFDHCDLGAIDPESSYRATRNFMRGLSIEVLEAWRLQDRDRFLRAAQRLRKVHDHCMKPTFDKSVAQEDHRGFAREILEAISKAEGATLAEQERVEPLATLIIKATYEDRFVAKIREIFAPYFPAR